MLGQMVNVSPCPRCHGEGKIVESPCETCHGEGRTERKRTLRVAIPAGIDEGHQIRLSNEGEIGPRGGAAGSLYVAVHVAAHPTLTREGTELYYEADLSIAQAALGTKIMVPTVEGEDTEVEIKPGTQPGTEIRLRGRGVPHLRRQSVRGDLHVIANVTVPTKLSKRQRELLEQYAAEGGEAVSPARRACARSWASGERRAGRRPVDATRSTASTSTPRPRRPGSWLELSIAADHEAVESVSEILSRAAPGGTSVEPAFELVDEGLAARVDLARPALVRAHLPLLDVAAVPRRGGRERSGTSATSRPSGCGRSATSRHASCRRPTGRTRGRRTSPCCGSAAGS